MAPVGKDVGVRVAMTGPRAAMTVAVRALEAVARPDPDLAVPVVLRACAVQVVLRACVVQVADLRACVAHAAMARLVMINGVDHGNSAAMLRGRGGGGVMSGAAGGLIDRTTVRPSYLPLADGWRSCCRNRRASKT